MNPGIYTMSMDAYVRTPAVSASLLNTFNERCAAAAWHRSWLNPHAPRESTDLMNAGTIAHAIVLEGSRKGLVIIDPEDYPAKNGNIPEGWTNTAIRAARDAAIADGKLPVIAGAMDKIDAMADAADLFIESLEHTEPAIFAAFDEGGGDSEISLLWDEKGTLCRARPDRINKLRNLVVDLKFTGVSANPEVWARTHMDELRAEHYAAGAKALFGVEDLEYVYLVVENEAPYLCSLVGLDPAARELGRLQRRHALEGWRSCVAKQFWPAYPKRVAYPEPKPWVIEQWATRAGENDELGIPYDISKLFKKNGGLTWPFPSGRQCARTWG